MYGVYIYSINNYATVKATANDDYNIITQVYYVIIL